MLAEAHVIAIAAGLLLGITIPLGVIAVQVLEDVRV